MVIDRSIRTRAMLASVSISQWTGRKLDRAASRKVTDDAHADEGAARVNKTLVARDALEKIAKIADQARRYHLDTTLPWLDNGARILPASLYWQFCDEMRTRRQEFEAAADDFAENYDALRESARQMLGDLYRDEDYPSAEAIRGRFRFTTGFLPLPDSADFRVDLDESAVTAIRDDIEARCEEAMQAAMHGLWDRVHGVVARMAERLSAYKPATAKGERATGVFRDSLVENVREISALLPALNVTGDPELARIADRIAAELAGSDADELRESTVIRQATAKSAESILEEMAGYCGTVAA